MFFGWHHFGLLLVLVAGQDGVFTRRPRHRSRKDAARRGERALARKTRARTEETEKWSIAEHALARKMRADETKKWSVAMIHIPKTAGSSIAEALWAGRHHACASYTGNLSLCNCKDTRCRSVAKVAVVEAPHRMVKALLGPMRREWLWVSIIRRPEDWLQCGGAVVRAAAPEDCRASRGPTLRRCARRRGSTRTPGGTGKRRARRRTA